MENKCFHSYKVLNLEHRSTEMWCLTQSNVPLQYSFNVLKIQQRMSDAWSLEIALTDLVVILALKSWPKDEKEMKPTAFN